MVVLLEELNNDNSNNKIDDTKKNIAPVKSKFILIIIKIFVFVLSVLYIFLHLLQNNHYLIQ